MNLPLHSRLLHSNIISKVNKMEIDFFQKPNFYNCLLKKKIICSFFKKKNSDNTHLSSLVHSITENKGQYNRVVLIYRFSFVNKFRCNLLMVGIRTFDFGCDRGHDHADRRQNGFVETVHCAQLAADCHQIV